MDVTSDGIRPVHKNLLLLSFGVRKPVLKKFEYHHWM